MPVERCTGSRFSAAPRSPRRRDRRATGRRPAPTVPSTVSADVPRRRPGGRSVRAPRLRGRRCAASASTSVSPPITRPNVSAARAFSSLADWIASPSTNSETAKGPPRTSSSAHSRTAGGTGTAVCPRHAVTRYSRADVVCRGCPPGTGRRSQHPGTGSVAEPEGEVGATTRDQRRLQGTGEPDPGSGHRLCDPCQLGGAQTLAHREPPTIARTARLAIDQRCTSEGPS